MNQSASEFWALDYTAYNRTITYASSIRKLNQELFLKIQQIWRFAKHLVAVQPEVPNFAGHLLLFGNVSRKHRIVVCLSRGILSSTRPKEVEELWILLYGEPALYSNNEKLYENHNTFQEWYGAEWTSYRSFDSFAIGLPHHRMHHYHDLFMPTLRSDGTKYAVYAFIFLRMNPLYYNVSFDSTLLFWLESSTPTACLLWNNHKCLYLPLIHIN